MTNEKINNENEKIRLITNAINKISPIIFRIIFKSFCCARYCDETSFIPKLIKKDNNKTTVIKKEKTPNSSIVSFVVKITVSPNDNNKLIIWEIVGKDKSSKRDFAFSIVRVVLNSFFSIIVSLYSLDKYFKNNFQFSL